MISDYFDFIKKVANQHPDVVKFRLIREGKEKILIQRWDNAPHHKEIETFPHHMHNGENIIPSSEPTFVEILSELPHAISCEAS